jgi:hypothetical protein
VVPIAALSLAIYLLVIPGLPEGQSPESIFQRPVFMEVFMGSGLSASPSPGMTTVEEAAPLRPIASNRSQRIGIA